MAGSDGWRKEDSGSKETSGFEGPVERVRMFADVKTKAVAVFAKV